MPENTCHLFGLLNITVLPLVNQFCSKNYHWDNFYTEVLKTFKSWYIPFKCAKYMNKLLSLIYLYIPFVKLIWAVYKLRGKSLGYWQKINSAGRDEYGV